MNMSMSERKALFSNFYPADIRWDTRTSVHDTVTLFGYSEHFYIQNEMDDTPEYQIVLSYVPNPEYTEEKIAEFVKFKLPYETE